MVGPSCRGAGGTVRPYVGRRTAGHRGNVRGRSSRDGRPDVEERTAGRRGSYGLRAAVVQAVHREAYWLRGGPRDASARGRSGPRTGGVRVAAGRPRTGPTPGEARGSPRAHPAGLGEVEHVRQDLFRARPCCGARVPLGVHDEAAPDTVRRRRVEAGHEHLVHDRVGLREHDFLGAVDGGRAHQVQYEVGALPRQVAGDFGEPGVVADRQAHASVVLHVEDHEAAAGRGGLVGPPREDLAVLRDPFARGRVDGAVL